MEDIEFAAPKLHIFVCTNDRSKNKDAIKSSCSPKITSKDVAEIKKWLVDEGLAARVYCTQSGCLGFCNKQGGVICVYPQGRFIKGIKSADDIKQIIKEELEKQKQWVRY